MVDAILFQSKMGVWDEMRSSVSLPLSLLYVASKAIQKFEIAIIDQRIEENWKEKLIELLNTKPLCVGFTALIGDQISNGLAASKLVKSINPEIPVIWGGIQTSLIPEMAIRSSFIDIVVMGEG